MKKSPWELKRENNAALKQLGTKAIRLVLVSQSFNGKRKLVTKGVYKTTALAQVEKRRLEAFTSKFDGYGSDYRILGVRQYAKLVKEIVAEQKARRQKGAVKAAATRKKAGPNNFIRCHCGAKSKKLYSEMGGLQTRKCQNGHLFEHDKWLADRRVMAMVFGGSIIPSSAITRPKNPNSLY